MSQLDNCARIGELLPEHLAGRLPAKEESAVRAHLKTCADCRRRANAVGLLQQTPVPAPDPARWDHFVEGVVLAAGRPRRRARVWLWPLAAAAVIVLAVALLVRAPGPTGSAAGLDDVARAVADLPDAQAATWTVGVDPGGLIPADVDEVTLSDEELEALVREVGRS